MRSFVGSQSWRGNKAAEMSHRSSQGTSSLVCCRIRIAIAISGLLLRLRYLPGHRGSGAGHGLRLLAVTLGAQRSPFQGVAGPRRFVTVDHPAFNLFPRFISPGELTMLLRSEERRVGKEWRSRCAPC